MCKYLEGGLVKRLRCRCGGKHDEAPKVYRRTSPSSPIKRDGVFINPVAGVGRLPGSLT
jgi:hypothetical protein